jgi:molybdate transport system ATP-binding protein
MVSLLGIGHLLERKPAQLSGGEQQRVAIARALAVNPEILLMDEPLASLDRKRKQEFLPYLERLRDELRIPIVYVSHQFEEVLQLATHVVLMQDGRVLTHDTLPAVSLRPEMRELIGAEAIGTVVEGVVQQVDIATGLAQVRIGDGVLNVDASELALGQRARMQLLARDLILALQPPHGLSVRNMLSGVITRLEPDDPHAVLVHVDIGGIELISRVTLPAARELNLQAGLALWLLVKAVTLRGRVYHGTRNQPT